jgi:putative ABC transport system permease protein
MIRNYLKIAARNLQRNKLYSLINIAGLTIGLTACLLVATVVLDDLSYDRWWKNSDHIYRIVSIDRSSNKAIERSAISFTGLGPNLKKHFPEVREYCRIDMAKENFKLAGSGDLVSLNTLKAEPSVWKVLDFQVVEGNPAYYQKGYKNLVITEKVKAMYFGGANPVGKIVTSIPEFGKPGTCIITGVIKDIPSNTSLRADVLEVEEMLPEFDILHPKAYGSFSEQYLLLQPSASVAGLEAKANSWYEHYFTDKERHYSIMLQQLKDIYLHSADLSFQGRSLGDIKNVYIFSGVAVFLLLIACINFVNLTTARALKRVREAGIRKILGADRRELLAQFLFESLLFFGIAFVLGLFLYSLFLKPVEKYLGHSLALTLQSNLLLFSITCGIVLLVSILAGLYPALLISAQNPVLTLKGKLTSAIGSGMLRKGLVVTQFTIAIIVLSITMLVQRQLHFLDNKDLGYDKNNLLHLKEISWDGKSNAFKQEVLTMPGVSSATITTWAPSAGGGGMRIDLDDPQHKEDKLKSWYIDVDLDFVRTMGFHLEKGRLLNAKYGADAINSDSLMVKGMNQLVLAQIQQPVLMTAYTAKAFGINKLNETFNGIIGQPVGVINDFNNESLKTTMSPVFIRASKNIHRGSMLIRVQPGSERRVLAGIYQSWQHFFPEKTFQYGWADEELRAQYASERKLQQLFSLFSFLILFLAALGLFGLTTFMAEMRVKEIGIRKVLGASAAVISVNLSKDFIKLVLLAMLIASPIAWYFVQQWLQNYAYQIRIHWWFFALSGTGATLIALATISYQTIKAALANPVRSLRNE